MINQRTLQLEPFQMVEVKESERTGGFVVCSPGGISGKFSVERLHYIHYYWS